MPNVTMVSIEAQVVWKVRQSTKSGLWIGLSDELNVTLEAASLDEMHSLIPEAIHSLMADLLQDNELDAFLREHGWTARNVPRDTSSREIEFDLPWQMITEGRNGPERRAH